MFINNSDHDNRVQLENLTIKLLVQRDGSVLSKNSILKLEHFPLSVNSHNSKTLPLYVHGAPNFRRTICDICGVAQPSISGLIAIYNILSLNNNGNNCCPSWLCIRDEPVVYLDGLPFVLREAEEPLQNMRAFSGISAKRVETLETKLVADILAEMKNNNGLVVIHEEQGFI